MAPLTGVKGDGTKLRVSSFNPVLRHLFGAGPGTAFDDDCSLLVEMFLRSLRTKDFPPIRQTKLHIYTHHEYNVYNIYTHIYTSLHHHTTFSIFFYSFFKLFYFSPKPPTLRTFYIQMMYTMGVVRQLV